MYQSGADSVQSCPVLGPLFANSEQNSDKCNPSNVEWKPLEPPILGEELGKNVLEDEPQRQIDDE